ncbi:MAG: WD40 repeat domain-containing protein [Planctomycetota bacterium]|nr:WD40 repeat domain-containing protein [Planctomycetota bacterium]
MRFPQIWLVVIVSFAANSSFALDPESPQDIEYPQVQACAFLSNKLLCTSIPSGREHSSAMRCWDVSTGREIEPFGAKPRTSSYGFAVSRDGKYLAAMTDGGIGVWDLSKPQPYPKVSTLKFNGTAFDFIGDTNKLATVNYKKLQIIELPSKIIATTAFPFDPTSLDVSPDGKLLASHSHIFEMEKQQEVATTEASEEVYVPPVFSPDGKYLAYGTFKELVVWDIANRRSLFRKESRRVLPDDEKAAGFADIDTPGPIVWTPDGKALVTRNIADQLHIVDSRTGDFKEHVFRDKFIANCYAYSPDGQHLAVTGSFPEGPTAIRIKNLKTDKVTTIKLDPFPKKVK